MNPLFDRKLFVPDGEAHVMPDGRLYVYGSIDISGSKTYCGEYYHVVSTDDPKLENWVDHGVSFATTPDSANSAMKLGIAIKPLKVSSIAQISSPWIAAETAISST